MSYMTYPRNCNSCGKSITIGFDASIQKWRPWDDYEGKINHQCNSKKLQQSVTANDHDKLLDELNSIKNNQASIIWMLQRVAAKMGVESQSGQS